MEEPGMIALSDSAERKLAALAAASIDGRAARIQPPQPPDRRWPRIPHHVGDETIALAVADAQGECVESAA
jgi:hypothetical protein